MARIRYDRAQFALTSTRGIYDKTPKSGAFPFDFLKFEAVKSDYLRNNGAEVVVQSWKNRGKQKILHSGLIPLIGHCGVYYGDNLNENGKKDYLLFVCQTSLVTAFIVKGRNPKNKQRFSVEFLSLLNEKGCL
jgi:hypothetical protein